ncbi:MAG: DUF4340 domain-containing protein [Oscillospiraceae bacterium]|jgi:hypothetical protein|nr:DUF4340 domain-containing protein [Oscillospiraceae bacterium]
MNKLGNNLKITVFSLIGLAVLGSTIAVLKLTAPKEEAPEEPDVPAVSDETVFTRLTADDVISVSVKNQKDEYTVSADANGGFIVNELNDLGLNIPLNGSLLTNLASNVAELSSKLTVEENAGDLDKYGLLSPSAQVRAQFADGTSIAFCVGIEAPAPMTVYFRLEGENKVYTVSSYKLNPFLNDKYYWIEKRLTEEYDPQTAPIISRVTINRADLDEPMLIEALPEVPLEETRTFNTHKLVSPVSVELDQEKARFVVYGMYGLTALEAVSVGFSESFYETVGLDEPFCEVQVRSGGKLFELKIGLPAVEKSEDGVDTLKGWFGICSEVPDVLYLFEPSALPWVYAVPEDLMAEMFLTPYIYSLDRLIIETESARLEFTITGDANGGDILLNGEKLTDDRRLKDLYQYLVGAKGEWIFMEESKSEFIARIVYKYKDSGFPDDTVEYYTADDRKSVVRLNGENIFKCRDLYTTRLVDNIDAFLSGGDIIQNW